MKHLKKHPKQQRMEDITFPLHKPGNCFYHPKELAVVNSETDAYELGITYFGLCQNCIRTRFDGEKVIWEGGEWLRSINDDLGFTFLNRLAWHLIAWGILVLAVVTSAYILKHGLVCAPASFYGKTVVNCMRK